MARGFGAGGALLVLMLAGGAQAQNPCLAPKNKTVTITNTQGQPATIFINFGADSAINANDLGSLCGKPNSPLNCQFQLGPNGSQQIPNPQMKYINMTLAFNAPITCGTTKAEMTVNNPNFCDVFDVSVVDGFNERMQITVDERPVGQLVTLGPPLGLTKNQNVFGVFPYGCDRCAANVSPPPACGPYPGNSACHAGTEFNPIPVCQYQSNQPNASVQIVLLPPSAPPVSKPLPPAVPPPTAPPVSKP
jgi:hypothetical protein